MKEVYEQFERWQALIRGKAAQYEHEARKNGEAVTSPSLDSIANEMDAFLAGLSVKQ